MGFQQMLNNLIQPMAEDDVYFPGSKTEPKPESAPPSRAAEQFEASYAAPKEVPEADDSAEEETAAPSRQSLFSGFGFKKPSQLKSDRSESAAPVARAAAEWMSPSDFDDVKPLVQFLDEGCAVTVVLRCESTDMCRRLLDFISGIAFAKGCVVEHLGGKTYIVRR